MNNKITAYFKRNYKDYIGVVVMFVMIFFALDYVYDFSSLDLKVPMQYGGGDDAGMLVNAKMVTEQGWVLSSDRMGAPYGTEYYDFSSNMLHNVGLFVMKLFAMVTGDVAVTLNLTFLLIFFMAGLVSYLVMRELKISRWIAMLASAAFAMSPYIIMRGIAHMVLSECYFIPLSLLLCIWIYERDDILCFNKNFFRNKRNYLAILFMFLIAGNGIAYYPFFTCFMLLVTGISKMLKTKKFRYLLKSFAAVGGICLFLVLNLIPGLIYYMSHGSNAEAIVRGGFVETELYGLKIIQLFLPVNNHGSWTLETIINKYNQNSMIINENTTSYITILGIIGVVLLVLSMFLKRNDAIKERLGLLSELNIMLLFLGTTGGLGTIFAFLITDMIRSYNRISIFIEYVAIVGIALVLNHLYRKYSANQEKRSMKYIVVGLGAVLCIGSLWEGIPSNSVPDYKTIAAEYESDGAFVSEIESQMPEGANIYQLPYHKYPEAGPVNAMCDYDLFAGYIHSNTLKWSYGGIKGREADQWSYEVSMKDYPDMVAYLKNQDFQGIYIDRRAYTEEEIQVLEDGLTKATGQTPMISFNGNLSFYNLNTMK